MCAASGLMSTKHQFYWVARDIGPFTLYAIFAKNSLKIACFLGPRFWRHFGQVLGGFWEAKIHDFRCFFEKKRKQKTRRFLEGKKNCILRPQEQTADEVRRWVVVRGKELRMGGKHLRKDLEAGF